MKSMRRSKLALFVTLVAFATVTLIPATLFAKGGGGGGGRSSSFSSSRSSSYSSFSSSKSYSSPSSSTWGSRSGGGIFSSPSGTTKPTTSNYTKPAAPPTGVTPAASGTKPTGPSNYAKPGAPPVSSTAATKQQAISSSKYEKPKATPIKAFSGGSKFDKKTVETAQKERSAKSLESYRKEQEKFKAPDKPVTAATASTYQSSTIYSSAKVPPSFSYNDYYRNRDSYWSGRSYSPPVYVYQSSPSFGMWDTIFLYSMLNNMNHGSSFAYNHSNDPGYQQWRKTADEQAKTNEELRAKLADMDKQVAVMKAEGKKADPNYLPAGVPAEVAISGAALAAKKPTKPILRVATGKKGGIYDWYGQQILKDAKGLDVKLIPTSGSVENLKLLNSGDVDMAIIQSDVIAMMPLSKPTEQSTIYEEVIQIVGNRDSGVKSVKSLDKTKHILYIGPEGSGTARAWAGLCDQDEWYKNIRTKNADYGTALDDVMKNPNAFAMYVGGLNSDIMKAAAKKGESGKLRLIEVDNKDFNKKKDKDGNSIYSFVEIPGSVYPTLQQHWWFFHFDATTLSVHAVLTLASDWVKENGPASLDMLTVAVEEAKPELDRKVYGLSH
jgi:TRAP transporter TAXI family solute receptor